MDTREKKAIIVHVNGSILVFKMCFDGLFYFDTANPLGHTINDNKEAITRGKIKIMMKAMTMTVRATNLPMMLQITTLKRLKKSPTVLI